MDHGQRHHQRHRPDGGSDAGPGTALRWTADGKELAFAFYANAKPGKNGYGYQQSASIRLLDTTAPGSSLLPDSKVLTGPGPVYTPASGTGMQCLAQDGWSISANGEALTCATQWGTPASSSRRACGPRIARPRPGRGR